MNAYLLVCIIMYRIPPHAIASEADKVVEWAAAENAYARNRPWELAKYTYAFPPDGMWMKPRRTVAEAVAMTCAARGPGEPMNTQVHIIGGR